MTENIPRSRTVLKPCIHCRARKVRCDRKSPCTECVRFNKICSYDEATPSRPDGSSNDQDVQSRLARLEAFMESHTNGMTNSGASTIIANRHNDSHLEKNSFAKVSPIGISEAVSLALRFDSPMQPVSFWHEGQSSIYVEPGFWGTMFQQRPEAGWQSLSAHEPPPAWATDVFLDNIGPQLKPTFEQASVMLKLFCEQVEPFIGILHVPTFQRLFSSTTPGHVIRTTDEEALVATVLALTARVLPRDVIATIFDGDPAAVYTSLAHTAHSTIRSTQTLSSSSLKAVQVLLYWITFLYEDGAVEQANRTLGTVNQIANRQGLHRSVTSQDQLSSFTEAELRSRTWNYLQYLNTKLYLFEGVHIPQESSFDVSYPLSIPDSEWDDWRQVPRPPPPAATNQRPKFPILRRQFATLSQYLLRRAPDLSIDNATTLLAALNDQLQRTYYEAFDQAQTIQRFEALCVRIWQERLALSLDATHITYGRRSGDEAEKEPFNRAITHLSVLERAEAAAQSFGYMYLFRTDPDFYATTVLLHSVQKHLHQLPFEDARNAWQHLKAFSKRHDNKEFSLRGSMAWRIFLDRKSVVERKLCVEWPEVLIESAAGGGPNDDAMIRDLS